MKGWYNERYRHYLASKGVTTKKYYFDKSKAVNKLWFGDIKKLPGELAVVEGEFIGQAVSPDKEIEVIRAAQGKSNFDEFGNVVDHYVHGDLAPISYYAEIQQKLDREYSLRYVQDIEGMPIWSSATVLAKDPIDAKKKLLLQNKDAYNIKLVSK